MARVIILEKYPLLNTHAKPKSNLMINSPEEFGRESKHVLNGKHASTYTHVHNKTQSYDIHAKA